jgi:hypothetical protein
MNILISAGSKLLNSFHRSLSSPLKYPLVSITQFDPTKSGLYVIGLVLPCHLPSSQTLEDSKESRSTTFTGSYSNSIPFSTNLSQAYCSNDDLVIYII